MVLVAISFSLFSAGCITGWFFFFSVMSASQLCADEKINKKADIQNTSSKLTSSNQKECNDVVVDSIIRRPIFDRNSNGINHTRTVKDRLHLQLSARLFQTHMLLC